MEAASTTELNASVDTSPIKSRAWKIAYESWGAW